MNCLYKAERAALVTLEVLVVSGEAPRFRAEPVLTVMGMNGDTEYALDIDSSTSPPEIVGGRYGPYVIILTDDQRTTLDNATADFEIYPRGYPHPIGAGYIADCAGNPVSLEKYKDFDVRFRLAK